MFYTSSNQTEDSDTNRYHMICQSMQVQRKPGIPDLNILFLSKRKTVQVEQ